MVSEGLARTGPNDADQTYSTLVPAAFNAPYILEQVRQSNFCRLVLETASEPVVRCEGCDHRFDSLVGILDRKDTDEFTAMLLDVQHGASKVRRVIVYTLMHKLALAHQ